MSGHSKWANIKHRKARQDAKRGKIFSKLIKKISSAARRGGPAEANNELRLLLEKAKAANVPAENVKRAVLKATGQLEGVSFEEFTYEGYGPGGFALMIEGATDNRNRTVASVRLGFNRNGGSMGENGSVAWMFESKGVIEIEAKFVEDEEELMELVLEHGADDFESENEVIRITTLPSDYSVVFEALKEAGYNEFLTDEITKVPQNYVVLTSQKAQQALRLIDFFEELDDVEEIYHNFNFEDE